MKKDNYAIPYTEDEGKIIDFLKDDFLYTDLVNTFCRFTLFNQDSIKEKITLDDLNVILEPNPENSKKPWKFNVFIDPKISTRFDNGYITISEMCVSFSKYWNDFNFNYLTKDNGVLKIEASQFYCSIYYSRMLSAISQHLAERLYLEFDLPDPGVITALSCQIYETKSCSGILALSHKEKRATPFSVVFAEKIVFDYENLRHCRKVLEASSKNQCVYMCKKGEHWFLKGYVDFDLCKRQPRIKISGNSSWDITIPLGYKDHVVKESIIVRYQNGLFGFPTEQKLNVDEFGKQMQKCFVNTAPLLTKIAKVAESSVENGTTLIFTNDSDEISRLQKYRRGTNIKKISLIDDSGECRSELIKNLCAIDGALVIDENGCCVCYGVILDGEAVEKGDPSTGSRHNSVKNYIKWKKINPKHKPQYSYVAVVISDDKYTEVYY